MKRVILSFNFLLLFVFFAQGGDLEVYFDHKTYSVPGDVNYVETHMEFLGKTLEHKKLENNLFQANVEITILLKQNDEIVDFKKLVIDGPEVPEFERIDFLDVQRFPISNGEFEFELEFRDLNDPGASALSHQEKFTVNIDSDKPTISDITLLKAYSKAEVTSDLTHSGFDLLPFVSDYFPTSANSIMFYVELYNTDKFFGEDEKYLLSYFIKKAGMDKVEAGLQVNARQETEAVTPLLTSFDITELSAGDYVLFVQVRSKLNELIYEQSIPFFRQKLNQEMSLNEVDDMNIEYMFSEEITDINVLYDYMQSCRPLASNLERNTIDNIPSNDLEILQKYFYHFWTLRDSANPQEAWNTYKKDVEFVNEEFSTRIMRGYETERGRVYLQYGKPNSRAVKHNNVSIYAYEVWHYYTIGNFTDKRFLFYNTDQVSNDFNLLTSDMPGEVKNNNWFEIMAQQTTSYDIATQVVDRNYSNTGNADLEILRDLYFNTR